MEKDLTNVHQSHGFTHGDYREIQAAQQQGTVEMTDPNNLDTVNDKYFQEDFKDYKVAKHERGFYHIAQESRSFSIRGERLSVPFVQKYSIQNFKEMLPTKEKPFSGFAGMDTAILHDPTKEKDLKQTDNFRHGQSVPPIKASDIIDPNLKEEIARLAEREELVQNKETELAEREAKLLEQEAELQKQREESEAESAKQHALKENEAIILSLPNKVIAELQQMAADLQVDLKGVTKKDDIVKAISEKLKPTIAPGN